MCCPVLVSAPPNARKVRFAQHHALRLVNGATEEVMSNRGPEQALKQVVVARLAVDVEVENAAAGPQKVVKWLANGQ